MQTISKLTINGKAISALGECSSIEITGKGGVLLPYTHKVKQCRTTRRFFQLPSHVKRPLPWINTGIIPWERAIVDRLTPIFPKSMVLLAH